MAKAKIHEADVDEKAGEAAVARAKAIIAEESLRSDEVARAEAAIEIFSEAAFQATQATPLD